MIYIIGMSAVLLLPKDNNSFTIIFLITALSGYIPELMRGNQVGVFFTRGIDPEQARLDLSPVGNPGITPLMKRPRL